MGPRIALAIVAALLGVAPAFGIDAAAPDPVGTTAQPSAAAAPSAGPTKAMIARRKRSGASRQLGANGAKQEKPAKISGTAKLSRGAGAAATPATKKPKQIAKMLPSKPRQVKAKAPDTTGSIAPDRKSVV